MRAPLSTCFGVVMAKTEPLIFEKCFKYILTEYQKSANSAADTIQRLKQVEKRGRYKNK